MPSGLADFGASSWLATILGLSPVPAGYYVALCLEQPGPGMDGAVLSDLEPPPGSAYGRQFVATGPADWVINGPYALNLNGLDFPVATIDWGLITHYAVLDSVAEGNLVGYGEFLVPIEVLAGDPMSIPPGGLVLTLADLEDSIAV